MKVVLDNNVFISGIFWKGAPHKIIELTERGKIEVFTTFEILEELFGVLQREKFKPLLGEGETNVEEVFRKVLELVEISFPKKEVDIIKEDTPDNNFLACAESCQASFIISGDKHLLKLKEFQGIPIVSPKGFLKIISNKKQ